MSNTKVRKDLKPIKTGAYDLYMHGLSRMKRDGQQISLEEARDIALADTEKVQGYEHIELINAAYEELKKQEKDKK